MNEKGHILYIKLINDLADNYHDILLQQINARRENKNIFDIDSLSEKRLFDYAYRFVLESNQSLIIINSYDKEVRIHQVAQFLMKLKRAGDTGKIGLILLGDHSYFKKFSALIPTEICKNYEDLEGKINTFFT